MSPFRAVRASADSGKSDGTSPIVGTFISLEPYSAEAADDLAELDWLRCGRPELGGWFQRPRPPTADSTLLFRSRGGGPALGVLEAYPLPGYPGVVNLSIFTDDSAPRGYAVEAYSLFISMLFQAGVRVVHQEVLEFNTDVHRGMRRAGIEATAVLREHGYAAGRFWDVYVYSIDSVQWQQAVARFDKWGVLEKALSGSG